MFSFTSTKGARDDGPDEKSTLLSALTLPSLSWLSDFSTTPSTSTIELHPSSSNDKSSRSWVKGITICTWLIALILFINTTLTIIATGLAYHANNQTRFAFAALYTGSCSTAKGWSIGLHLVINVLSTAMLGASNYCMQCLASPSRKQVDEAHQRRKWVKIGVPDIGGLLFARKGKGQRQEGYRWLLGWVLFASSLPIHLIYNSAIYYSLGLAEYTIIVAPPGPVTVDTSDHFEGCFEHYMDMNMSAYNQMMARTDLQHLTNEECISQFSQDYVSGKRMLILVTNDEMRPGEALRYVGLGNGGSLVSTDWMCTDQPFNCAEDHVLLMISDGDPWVIETLDWASAEVQFSVSLPTGLYNGSDYIPDLGPTTDGWTPDLGTLNEFLQEGLFIDQLQVQLDNGSNWQNASFPDGVTLYSETGQCHGSGVVTDRSRPSFAIDHCLVVPQEETCELYFSLPICLIVLGCNLAKLVCAWLTAKDNRDEVFLTTGDAISSYLSRPDPATEGCCLLSKPLIDQGAQGWRASGITLDRDDEGRLALPVPRHKRWFQAVSKTQWSLTLAVFIAILIPSIFLLDLGIEYLGRGAQGSIWDHGLGAVSSNGASMLIPLSTEFSTAGVFKMVLLANVPQLLVSIAYFMLNALLTGMLGAVEYASYATTRKPLRVSSPRGQQRSTYYLSLPYQYSMPLLSAAAVLHWLVSQSLYYVQIIFVDLDGVQMAGKEMVTCGYSPVAIIFAIAIGGSLPVFSMLLGLRKFKSSMPLAAQYSAPISAACHVENPRENDDLNHALKPVMWGETGEYNPPAEDALAFRNRIAGRSDLVNGIEHGIESGFFHCAFSAGEVYQPRKGRLYI